MKAIKNQIKYLGFSFAFTVRRPVSKIYQRNNKLGIGRINNEVVKQSIPTLLFMN